MPREYFRIPKDIGLWIDPLLIHQHSVRCDVTP